MFVIKTVITWAFFKSRYFQSTFINLPPNAYIGINHGFQHRRIFMYEHLEIEPIKRQQYPLPNWDFDGTLIKRRNGTIVSTSPVYIEHRNGRISGSIGGRSTTGFVTSYGYTVFSIAGFSSGIHLFPPEEYRGWFIGPISSTPRAVGTWSSPFQGGGQWSLSLSEHIH